MKYDLLTLGLLLTLVACATDGTLPPPVPLAERRAPTMPAVPSQAAPLGRLPPALPSERAAAPPTRTASEPGPDWFVERAPHEGNPGAGSGEWRTRYSNGQLRSEYTFLPNHEPSVMRFYYQEGTPQAEGAAVDGVKQGVWKYWHANGSLAKQGSYVNGIGEGIWTYWDEQGLQIAQGNLRGGVRVGEWAQAQAPAPAEAGELEPPQ